MVTVFLIVILGCLAFWCVAVTCAALWPARGANPRYDRQAAQRYAQYQKDEHRKWCTGVYTPVFGWDAQGKRMQAEYEQAMGEWRRSGVYPTDYAAWSAQLWERARAKEQAHHAAQEQWRRDTAQWIIEQNAAIDTEIAQKKAEAKRRRKEGQRRDQP